MNVTLEEMWVIYRHMKVHTMSSIFRARELKNIMR
jgi:hypothetical protein